MGLERWLGECWERLKARLIPLLGSAADSR
jgi:hypothetical protein